MATPDTVRPLRAWVKNEFPLRFEEAVGLISEAVRRGLPTSRNQYQNVAVLMLHWEHDDIGVVPLENEMANLFEQLFNYRVERYVIEPYPSNRNSERNLSDRLTAFRNKYEGPRNLLIYVYSGHAWSGPSSFECRLYGSTNPPAGRNGQPEIDWLRLRVNTDLADGDTLYIFDCCFAATGAVQHQDTEYLAALAMELPTTTSLIDCMTNRLIGLLRRYQGAPMTIAQYHSQLLAEMHEPTHYLETTPVYVPSYSKPSTVLAPMPSSSARHSLQGMQDFNRSTAKVLVSFTLHGLATIPTVRDFEIYLLSQVPAQVAEIKVEAAFKADSQVYLVTMPAAVWDELPEHKSVNFVAHVKSSNVLQAQIQEPGLAVRPKGSENIRPHAGSSGQGQGSPGKRPGPVR